VTTEGWVEYESKLRSEDISRRLVGLNLLLKGVKMQLLRTVLNVRGRVAVLSVLLTGSLALLYSQKRSAFTPYEKPYYADPSVIEYVQPGLTITIVSAKIASDGTISVDYKVSDPTGAPLDLSGMTTPGPISLSFLAAYIPKGQEQYMSYIVRTATAASGATAIQAAADSGGATTTVSTGEYIYSYHTKAAAGFDPTDTNRIGIYGSRNLAQWDLGTNYADATSDFVPAGGTPAPRDIVRTADCNSCHGLPNGMTSATGSAGLAAHGGSRRDVQLCIICHQPQTSDPNTGNSLDMKQFIHKIHMGSSLPSVQAGAPYQIIGFQNSVNDFSSVVYPADVRRCQTCHNPKNGASQTNAWLTEPTRAACGSCHDDANFATGVNHPGGPQIDDNLCSDCHIAQGELPFDASILGAHLLPGDTKLTWPLNPDPLVGGVQVTITGLTNTLAGQNPKVAFHVKDLSANTLAISSLSSLSFTMAGPTSDYGYTSFGGNVTTPGYVSESATAATCDSVGNCTYTFQHAIPPKATGSYALGVEARRSETILAGTTTQMTAQTSSPNQVVYFSVDGSAVRPRRTVVSTANCNQCHGYLSLHGSLRNNTEYCVFCHNPSDTDASPRAMASNPADAALPPQGINFPLMVHKIHTGENLEAQFNQDYAIVGFGGSHNDFGAAFASVPAKIPDTGVRFPAMGPTGAVQDTAECYLCHANGSEAVLPIGKNAVVDPQGLLNPAPATTSACTACHLNQSAFAHADVNTDPRFGESCDVCHGTGAAFSATQVHAGQ
jgi:OmcA/MtrC family decaheme c-type cytochrome